MFNISNGSKSQVSATSIAEKQNEQLLHMIWEETTKITYAVVFLRQIYIHDRDSTDVTNSTGEEEAKATEPAES